MTTADKLKILTEAIADLERALAALVAIKKKQGGRT